MQDEAARPHPVQILAVPPKYDSSDADEAIDEPSVQVIAMMGLLVGF